MSSLRNRRLRVDLLGLSIAALVLVGAGHRADVVRAEEPPEIAEGKVAAQVSGVTAVENSTVETRSVERRLRVAVDRLLDRTWALVDQVPLMLLAVGVFGLAILLSGLVARLEAPFRLVTKNVFLQDLVRQGARLIVIVVGALIGLELMDATALVGAVLGAAGVVGLALGFAFRDLVENYVASILLSVRQPFAPGDHVEIEGKEGFVARLTSRATILVTFDGNHVRIPNAIVFKGVIENYTRKPERRFGFGVGVGVEEDLVAAQALGTGILDEMAGVLAEPAPFCRVEELGDSSVTLRFFAWVDQRSVDFGKVRSEAIRLVKQAFDDKGIEMPEPIHRVRLESMPDAEEAHGDGASARRAESSRPQTDVQDISIDRHVESLVDEERRGAGDDLLSEDARPE